MRLFFIAMPYTPSAEAKLREAIRRAMRDQQIRQEQLGAEVAYLEGRDDAYTQGVVSDWLNGNTAMTPSRLFAIEKALGRKPGDLSKIVGYVPVGAHERCTVRNAIESDPELNSSQREILLAAYKAAVAQTRKRRQ